MNLLLFFRRHRGWVIPLPGPGLLLLPLFLTPSAPSLYAADDPVALKNEGQAIMAAYRSDKATKREYALAILKLERALILLEEAGRGDSALANEIAASAFWAKRMSTMPVIKLLDRLRKEGGYKLPTRFSGAGGSADPESAFESEDRAQKALKAAQAFAKRHPDDDFAVAQRFFLVAGEYPGSIAGTRALSLCRDALLRYANRNDSSSAEKEEYPVREALTKGDELTTKGDYDKAVLYYRRALRIKEAPEPRRHLGRGYFHRAQKMREDILYKWEELKSRLEEARRRAYVYRGGRRVFNPYDPKLVKAQRENTALRRQASDAKRYFGYAKREFELVIRGVQGGKDLEAAVYIALCLRGREATDQAKPALERLVRDYRPANDYEGVLYEYAKIELESLGTSTR